MVVTSVLPLSGWLYASTPSYVTTRAQNAWNGTCVPLSDGLLLLIMDVISANVVRTAVSVPSVADMSNTSMYT